MRDEAKIKTYFANNSALRDVCTRYFGFDPASQDLPALDLLKSAYRKAALSEHPDRHKARLQLIGDPEKRAAAERAQVDKFQQLKRVMDLLSGDESVPDFSPAADAAVVRQQPTASPYLEEARSMLERANRFHDLAATLVKLAKEKTSSGKELSIQFEQKFPFSVRKTKEELDADAAFAQSCGMPFDRKVAEQQLTSEYRHGRLSAKTYRLNDFTVTVYDTKDGDCEDATKTKYDYYSFEHPDIGVVLLTQKRPSLGTALGLPSTVNATTAMNSFILTLLPENFRELAQDDFGGSLLGRLVDKNGVEESHPFFHFFAALYAGGRYTTNDPFKNWECRLGAPLFGNGIADVRTVSQNEYDTCLLINKLLDGMAPAPLALAGAASASAAASMSLLLTNTGAAAAATALVVPQQAPSLLSLRQTHGYVFEIVDDKKMGPSLLIRQGGEHVAMANSRGLGEDAFDITVSLAGRGVRLGKAITAAAAARDALKAIGMPESEIDKLLAQKTASSGLLGFFGGSSAHGGAQSVLTIEAPRPNQLSLRAGSAIQFYNENGSASPAPENLGAQPPASVAAAAGGVTGPVDAVIEQCRAYLNRQEGKQDPLHLKKCDAVRSVLNALLRLKLWNVSKKSDENHRAGAMSYRDLAAHLQAIRGNAAHRDVFAGFTSEVEKLFKDAEKLRPPVQVAAAACSASR